MIAFTFVLFLALAAWIAAGLAMAKRRARREARRLPGQLSAAERRRLYQRLGIDPAALAARRNANVLWLDPRIIDKRTDA